MAKISLRSYTQDIERMVENGRTEEAVAHCRNILQTYSKCVEVYRLLGKAYLESQRFGDAADIFQRVLSSIPEDFVSHVGMSLIREDEGNLDEAIWHMERAFEIQPSNGAIQDELRRLYGKRDGLEPPKIRLTRGALARMYYKGELYQQAIAELRAALAEDANRLDLQVLLASVHYKAGQRVDAAEKANNILRKLPNCMEANLILEQVLAGTERDEEAKSYRQRLVFLDPYFAYVSNRYPSPELVPDQAITLEKITWKPGQTPAGAGGQPAWAASLGIDIGAASKSGDSLPDWLAGVQETERNQPDSRSLPALTPEETQAQGPLPDFLSDLAGEQPAPAQSADEIPDWMKDAGWAPSTGETEKAEASFKIEEPEPAKSAGDEHLLQADIPDWLQAMAPAKQARESEPISASEDEDVLPWLDALLPASPQGGKPTVEPAQTAAPAAETLGDFDTEMPDWIADMVGKEGKSPEALPAESEMPAELDWLSANIETSAPAEPSDELPDWLLQGESQPTVRTGRTQPKLAAPEKEIPDWMLEINQQTPTVEAMPEHVAKASPEEEIPDWLLGIGEEKPTTEAAGEKVKPPAWLQGEAEEAISTAETPAAEEPVAEIEEAAPVEEIPAWLFETAGEAPAAEESFAEIEEAAPAEEIPAWLLETAGEAPAAAVPTAAPSAEMDADAAFAWLESLAVKQGAEEALLLKPEERTDKPPEWVLKETTQAEQPETPVTEEPFAEIEEAIPAEEIPAWLLETAGEAPAAAEPVAEIGEAAPAEEIPAWLFETAGEAPVAEEPVAEIGEAIPAEEIPAWLLETAGEAPVAEEPFAEIEEAIPAEEIPAWLFETAGEAPVAEEPVAEIEEAIPAEEIPAWLLETAGEAPAAAVPTAAPSAEMDADAAFAWLESLAVKQGAEEALLLKPEERTDKPPEWVLKETTQAEQPETPVTEEPFAEIEEAIPAEEIPAWLLETAGEAPAAAEPVAEIGEAAPAEEIPAWLFETAGEAPVAEEPVAEIGEAIPAEEIPAWLLETAGEAPVAEEPFAEIEEAIPAEEIPAWLFETAGEAPVAEEPVAEIEEAIPAEEIPAWLLETAGEAPAAAVPTAAPSAEMDADAAFAWLESLAVKQGAEEALLLKPEERTDKPPEWVLKETTQAEQPETPVTEEPFAEIEEAIPAEEIPAWLLETAGEAPAAAEPVAEIGEAAPAEEIPAWLFETAGEAPVAEEPVAEIGEAIPAEEIPAWLLETAGEAPVAEEPFAEIEEAIPAEEIPAWLFETAGEAPVAEEPVAEIEEAIPAEEIPAWLLETAGEAPAAAVPTAAPSTEMEADAAFAWLESLAVKQGAEEALLLKPEERTDKPPEWVLKETAQTEEKPSIEEPAIVEEQPAAQLEPAAPDWMEKLEAESPVDPLADTRPTIRPPMPEPGETAPAVEIYEAAPISSAEFIEEAPIAAAPVAPSAEMDADAAFAWLESLAVKQGAEEALLLKPEERTDKPPEWVLKETAQAAQPESPAELAAIEIAPVEVEQPPYEEQPEVEEKTGSPVADTEAPSADMDADAAFAWLESLAVGQGAEEALLLKPEERTETPPDWVFAAQAAGEQAAQEPVESALEAEMPVVEEAITPPAEPATQPAVETPVAPAIPKGIAKEETVPAPSEELPDLPSWLSDSSTEAEELEWTPPPVKVAAPIELNTASLVELERLPGVGFIMAQNILHYRETSSPFYKAEDLLAVPGMSQATLELIRERIFVEAPEPPPAPPPVEKPIVRTVILSTDARSAPADLSEARNALNQGQIDQALAAYRSLIRDQQSLGDVIADLQEAAYHYSDNVHIWQHLGDAHLHANQTKEALESYITAEKLLR